EEMADIVEITAQHFAHQLRIPVPVKTRTVAPTGTIAKMPGVSEGIHPIFSKYFVRRIRFSDIDTDQCNQSLKTPQRATTSSPASTHRTPRWLRFRPRTLSWRQSRRSTARKRLRRLSSLLPI